MRRCVGAFGDGSKMRWQCFGDLPLVPDLKRPPRSSQHSAEIGIASWSSPVNPKVRSSRAVFDEFQPSRQTVAYSFGFVAQFFRLQEPRALRPSCDEAAEPMALGSLGVAQRVFARAPYAHQGDAAQHERSACKLDPVHWLVENHPAKPDREHRSQ